MMWVVKNNVFPTPLRGRIGTEVLIDDDEWVGLDFGEPVKDKNGYYVTHNLDHNLAGDTGYYIQRKFLTLPKNEIAKQWLL